MIVVKYVEQKMIINHYRLTIVIPPINSEEFYVLVVTLGLDFLKIIQRHWKMLFYI